MKQGVCAYSTVLLRATWKPLLCEGFSESGLEVSLKAPGRLLICYRDICSENCREVLACRDNMALLMRLESTPKIIGRADINVTVTKLEEIDVPHGNSLPALLRSFGRHPSPTERVACHPKPARAKGRRAETSKESSSGPPSLLRSYARHPLRLRHGAARHAVA